MPFHQSRDLIVSKVSGLLLMALANKSAVKIVDISKINELVKSTENEFDNEIDIRISEIKTIRQGHSKKKTNRFLPENKTMSFVNQIINSKMTL
jgi:hypothetical protein